jgi:hypothetical protein
VESLCQHEWSWCKTTTSWHTYTYIMKCARTTFCACRCASICTYFRTEHLHRRFHYVCSSENSCTLANQSVGRRHCTAAGFLPASHDDTQLDCREPDVTKSVLQI